MTLHLPVELLPRALGLVMFVFTAPQTQRCFLGNVGRVQGQQQTLDSQELPYQTHSHTVMVATIITGAHMALNPLTKASPGRHQIYPVSQRKKRWFRGRPVTGVRHSWSV